MKRIRRTIACAAALLLPAFTVFSAPPDIPILVDGVPLDARAIAVRGEVYIPAWILENYGGTKVEWIRPANLLEIVTTSNPQDSARAEGVLKVRVGSYLASEGSPGKTARLFLMNTDPKEFRFSDGRTAAERAHEGTITRIGPASTAAREYLRLSPAERSSRRGWEAVARMPKEEISVLPVLVERYESLYNTFYHDLLTNLVLGTAERVRDAGSLDPALKKIAIRPIVLEEDGTGSVRVPTGVGFLFGLMLQGDRQIVWNVPVVIQGSAETLVELSHRNAVTLK